MEVHAISTWFDRRSGVCVVEDDVQNVVRDIKSIDPRLIVYYNEQGNEFDIVERCLDGNERLVFTVDELDQRVPNRLRGIDHWGGRDDPNFILPDDEDFVAQVDAHNEKLQADQKAVFHDELEDAGKRLAWALDNCSDQHSVGGSILVSKDI
jgi:hypothetical protein